MAQRASEATVTVDPKPRRRVGRETKLDDEKANKIIELLRAGNFRTVAAGVAGVHPHTMVKWLAKGRDQPDSVYGHFRLKVIAAEREAEARAVMHVQRGMQKDWKAAAWYLATKHGKKWGKKMTGTLEAGQGGTNSKPFILRFDVSGTPPEKQLPALPEAPVESPEVGDAD